MIRRHASARRGRGSGRSRTARAGIALTATVSLAAALAAPTASAQVDAPEWDPAPSYTSTDQGDGTYTVPLFNADVPDISVARVPAAESGEGRDVYYMISTTMHLSPGAPVMKSYDLVNWEIVTYVFDRGSINDSFSLRNGQNSYGQGQWASSLRYHDGRFYVFFNTNNLGGAYIFSTDDVENGTWERTALGRALHDGSLFFDEANGGTPYVFYGSGTVNAVQLSEDLTEIVAEYPNIVRPADYPGQPFVGGLFEGTQVFEIDGQYYLVLITWPPGQGRQVVLFRAEELLGRHQTEDGSNPYIARSGLNSNGFAQGSLVPITGPDGEDVWHGMFFRDTFPIGRIPALIPATWSDGWPVFGNDGVVPVNGAFPRPIELSGAEHRLERQKSIVASDDFANDAPHRPWMDEEWEIPAAPDIDESLLDVELLVNGGFEDGTAGWQVNGTAQLQASEDAHSGDQALLVTGRTGTASGPIQDVTAKVQPGITYDVSAMIRYDNPDSPATKQFFITTHNGGSSYTNRATATARRGEWTRIQGSFTVPSGQPPATMRLFVETPWVNDDTVQADPDAHVMDFLLDDVSLVGRPTTTEHPHPDEIAFNGSRLDEVWQWNHAPDNRYWSLTDRDGWLRLTTGKAVTGDYVFTKLGDRPELTYFEEARNTLSQRTFGPRASAETALDFSGMRDGDTAGLAVYNRGFSYIAVRREAGETTLGVVNRVQPFPVAVDQEATEAFLAGSTVDLGDATEVHLKADADFASPTGQLWTTFYYSLDGETWEQLGGRVGPQTLDGSLAHFMGHRFGLFNYATEEAGGHVDFDHFLLSDTLTAEGRALDTTPLDAAIAHAHTLDAADYPADAWEAMSTALTTAEEAREAGFSTQNQIDAPERALSLELARLGVIAEQQPALDVTVGADTRCVVGRLVVAVRVHNGEDVPVTVEADSGFGSRTFADLAPGRGAAHAFSTRQVQLPAGEVDLTVTPDGGPPVQVSVPYPSSSCAA